MLDQGKPNRIEVAVRVHGALFPGTVSACGSKNMAQPG